MANMYLVCGISGGGKSVLTDRLITANPYLTKFDPDMYYAKINGDECDRSNWFDVWMSLYQDIHKAELANKDIIVTTNSLTVSQRTQFLEWFPTFTHHILWVTAPKEQCLEGNNSRRRHVPEKKLLQQWEEMEFPNASEKGWETITQITNFWEEDNYIIFNLKGDIKNYLIF